MPTLPTDQDRGLTSVKLALPSHDAVMRTKSGRWPVDLECPTPLRQWIPQLIVYTALLGCALLSYFMMYYVPSALVALAGLANANVVVRQGTTSSSKVPDYEQLTPELFPGPTPTGVAAFLAQTNPAAGFTGTTYLPNSPLETQVPIVGNTDNGNIFQMMGQLSHYFPNPDGFGVDEYPIPKNGSIVQLNMLSRHGSRYPTTGAGATVLVQKILNYTTGVLGNVPALTGPLEFLNTYKNPLGAEILVPVGKQELFDSGTLHQIMYGKLYPNNGTKIIARSTTQDRMTKSAEYFLAGFFGLDWQQNATLVLAIENSTGIWNNTLAGYDNCNNSNTYVSTGGTNATKEFYNIYLADAVKRLNAYGPTFNWSTTDAYNAQSLCAYETVALGYSAFCGLFNYTEWESYEYSVDLSFAGNNMFQSPTGRAVGIGYVQEILARLNHHLITSPVAQDNVTLDSMPSTFPLNQTLNFDFSHDTNIASILTAFGLTQFAPVLPADHIQRNRSLIVSHMEPFGARLDMEIIETPQPLSGDRKSGDKYLSGGTTRYIHFILNQRTIPLGVSLSKCGIRDDGWCELTTFMEIQSGMLAEAQYEYSCFGKYPTVAYGGITNGVPTNATGSATSSTSASATSSVKSSGSATATAYPSGGSTSGRATCSVNGALVCNGESQFGLCNFGNVIFQNVAKGTACRDGKIVAA